MQNSRRVCIHGLGPAPSWTSISMQQAIADDIYCGVTHASRSHLPGQHQSWRGVDRVLLDYLIRCRWMKHNGNQFGWLPSFEVRFPPPSTCEQEATFKFEGASGRTLSTCIEAERTDNACILTSSLHSASTAGSISVIDTSVPQPHNPIRPSFSPKFNLRNDAAYSLRATSRPIADFHSTKDVTTAHWSESFTFPTVSTTILNEAI